MPLQALKNDCLGKRINLMRGSMAVKYLIINADDYGYYSCVSKGILQGVHHGSITATGIMANGPHFEEHIEWLNGVNKLDKGVHLNISYGRPLSKELAEYLEQGKFSNKLAIVRAILTHKVPVQLVEKEWRLQIERCLAHQVDIRFLNSHEHLHMLPSLYNVFCQLVNEYQLHYSRDTISEWQLPLSIGSLTRNSALSLMNIFNARQFTGKSPKILGMNESGNLSYSYLMKAFSALKQGRVYELMCHPGLYDKNEITDSSLLDYHNWEGELNLLLSDEFKKLCVAENIELINYRQLKKLNINNSILS